jgi:hypothetical protein
MRDFAFPPDVLDIVRHERYHPPRPRVQQKREVMWRKSQGRTHEAIARLAGLSRRSVQRYLDGGIDRLYELRWKGKHCPLDDHRTALEEDCVEHPPRTVREAREAIDGCLDRLPSEYKAQMDSLLTHRFQTFDDVPVLSA